MRNIVRIYGIAVLLLVTAIVVLLFINPPKSPTTPAIVMLCIVIGLGYAVGIGLIYYSYEEDEYV